MTTRRIRRAAVAGMFYPGHPAELRDTVLRLLDEAHPDALPGTAVGLVAPHAGYAYSGLTAAYGYKAIQGGSFDTFVLISPSHREYFDGVSVFSGDAYETPLGVLEVDRDLRRELTAAGTCLAASEDGHRKEHAVEVHLPFLQLLFGSPMILPIVMGDQKREYCFALGETLARCIAGRKVLLIASSDLSHYHPYDEANRLDRIVTNDIAASDPDQLMRDLELERTEACGGGPVVALLTAARRLSAVRSSILHHCNSGDVTGDTSGVVGYLSAAVCASR